MNDDVLPLLMMLLMGVVVVLLLVIAAILLPRAIRTRTLKAACYCPWTGRRVVLRYLADGERHPIGVISCTAFADPTIVTCEKLCLAGGGPDRLATEEQPDGSSAS